MEKWTNVIADDLIVIADIGVITIKDEIVSITRRILSTRPIIDINKTIFT